MANMTSVPYCGDTFAATSTHRIKNSIFSPKTVELSIYFKYATLLSEITDSTAIFSFQWSYTRLAMEQLTDVNKLNCFLIVNDKKYIFYLMPTKFVRTKYLLDRYILYTLGRFYYKVVFKIEMLFLTDTPTLRKIFM